MEIYGRQAGSLRCCPRSGSGASALPLPLHQLRGTQHIRAAAAGPVSI